MMKRTAPLFLFALTFLTLPMVAQAQRRSPLADAPAIRKRVELRQSRLELAAGLGTTVNQTFYHGVLADVRLGYHINDWLALAGVGSFGVTTITTGLNEQLASAGLDGMGRTPSKAEALGGMDKVGYLLGGRVELTPFTGKYSLFGALFAHYDFYLFGGAALVNFVAVTPTAGIGACNASTDKTTCVASGSRIAGMGGLGFHTYFNDWIALGVELRTLYVQDNQAGRGVAVTNIINQQAAASTKDLTWGPQYMAIIGATLFLPSTADISP